MFSRESDGDLELIASMIHAAFTKYSIYGNKEPDREAAWFKKGGCAHVRRTGCLPPVLLTSNRFVTFCTRDVIFIIFKSIGPLSLNQSCLQKYIDDR